MDISILKTLALSGGNWVIYSLLACSVASVAAMVDRAICLTREYRLDKDLRAALAKNMSKKLDVMKHVVLQHDDGSVRRILCTMLNHFHHGADVEHHLNAATLEEKNELERGLLVLGTLGSSAPFIGLFGTVLGVIKAFHDLSQSAAGPEVVMRGLSEALIATAVGLFVAIPSVIAYNYFQMRVKRLLSGSQALGRVLVSQARMAGAKAD